jgi:hypothetical protein
MKRAPHLGRLAKAARVVVCAATLTVAGKGLAPGYAEELIVDTYDFGGVLFLSWTSRNSYEGHTSLISVTTTKRVRDVRYLILAQSGDVTQTLAEGEFRNLRVSDFQILTSQKQEIGDNSELTACASYYSIDEEGHYLSVSFYREPDIIGDSARSTAAGPSIERLVPVRIRHDGAMSCEAILAPDRLQTILAADRLGIPPSSTPSVERSANPDNPNMVALATWLVNGNLHGLEANIRTMDDIADVDYLIQIVDTKSSVGPMKWSGKVPFITRNTHIDAALADADDSEEKKLPLETVRFDVCLGYFHLPERRFVRERWQGTANYDDVVKFKDTTLPQTVFPDGDVTLEFADHPLVCGA